MLDHSPDPAREGESRSYEELYVEHAPAARRLALSMVPADVADDIVAEAFARVLAAIRAGGGPSHAFRGYLLTAVRHQAHDWLQARRRLTVVADLDVQDEAVSQSRVNPGIGSAADTQLEARDEARLVTRAFGRLPARWREVLWQLEVEGKAPAAVAPMFGLSANGVSALAMRAREGLRQAYLDEHVGTNIPAACRTYAAEFGAGARGRLSQRRRAAMQEHLGQCQACQALFTELTELNSRLGTILTPAALAAAARALGSAKRATIVRTSLTGHWRTWRWHPVTTVTGAAAGVAVVGGMLLAVNVTPVTSPPAHAATGTAVPAAVPAGPSTRKRQPGGGAPGGGVATAGGTAATRSGPRSQAGPRSPAGPGSLAGAVSLAAATPPSGPITGALPGGSTPGASAPGAPAAGSTQASQAPSNGGTSAASTPANPGQTLVNTTGATVTSLVNTAGNAVTGLVNTAGTTVTGVTNAASGLVNTAATTVTGVTNTATGAVTGITSTAGATVAAAGKTVSNAVSGVASTATNAVSGVASTATNAVSGVASTATSAADTASAASTVASTATKTVTSVTSSAAATAANTASAAPAVASSAAKTVNNATATVTNTGTAAASTATAAATSTANTVATATTGLVGAATASL